MRVTREDHPAEVFSGGDFVHGHRSMSCMDCHPSISGQNIEKLKRPHGGRTPIRRETLAASQRCGDFAYRGLWSEESEEQRDSRSRLYSAPLPSRTAFGQLLCELLHSRFSVDFPPQSGGASGAPSILRPGGLAIVSSLAPHRRPAESAPSSGVALTAFPR